MGEIDVDMGTGMTGTIDTQPARQTLSSMVG